MRPPLRVLQGLHAVTMFVHDDFPPRDFGVTWSSESWEAGNFLPQYWQRFSSRARMLRRLNFTSRLGTLSYVMSRMTRGTTIAKRGVMTNWSCVTGRWRCSWEWSIHAVKSNVANSSSWLSMTSAKFLERSAKARRAETMRTAV